MTLLITAKAFWAWGELPNCTPLQDYILKVFVLFLFSAYVVNCEYTEMASM